MGEGGRSGVVPDLRWVLELGVSGAVAGAVRLAWPLEPEGVGVEEAWRRLAGANSRLLRRSASKSDLLKVMV